MLTLLDWLHPSFSVARLLALIRERVTDPDQLKPVLQLPLSANWRLLSERRQMTRRVEDWSRR